MKVLVSNVDVLDGELQVGNDFCGQLGRKVGVLLLIGGIIARTSHLRLKAGLKILQLLLLFLLGLFFLIRSVVLTTTTTTQEQGQEPMEETRGY